MRIIQLANFRTATSGGLRVVMDRLAEGYRSRGHRVLQIVPGHTDGHEITGWGRRTTVASPLVPGAGGYRVILRLRHVERLIRAFDADVVEVSDRATLAHLATRRDDTDHRVVLVAHERLDQILGAGAFGAVLDRRVVRRASDRWNPRCWAGVDRVVVPSRFAADEWHRVGIVPNVVPWGVDLDTFRPGDARRRDTDTVRLSWVGRLTAEKRPDLAIDALRHLCGLEVAAELTLVGDGPLRDALMRRAGGLPVRFVGHCSDLREVASYLRASDVSLATSGIESFGLAALEALACGTPVVTCDGGAVPDVVGDAGRVVPADAASIAAAALVLAGSTGIRRASRTRAEAFPWSHAVDAMLEILDRPARAAA